MKVVVLLEHDILTLPNWLDFRFKALLSSHSVMCSPWWPLSAIECPLKSKLPTANYLSPWMVHLYHNICGDPSEILRASSLKLSKPALAGGHTACIVKDDSFNLAHAQIVYMVIVILSLLCTCLLLLFCLNTQIYTLIATVTCMNASGCLQSSMVIATSSVLCAQGLCSHHWGISTLVLLIYVWSMWLWHIAYLWNCHGGCSLRMW